MKLNKTIKTLAITLIITAVGFYAVYLLIVWLALLSVSVNGWLR